MSHYSMLIQWSPEDAAFLVTLPEFDNAKTHGDSYEEAARAGRELIESFILWYEQDGKPLPDATTIASRQAMSDPKSTRAGRKILL